MRLQIDPLLGKLAADSCDNPAQRLRVILASMERRPILHTLRTNAQYQKRIRAWRFWMSAHESLERAEHMEQVRKTDKNIALLIAAIALFLAFSETLGKSAQTTGLAKNVEASNLWAFFQAKTIRRTVLETASEQALAGLVSAPSDPRQAAIARQITAWQSKAARYRSEPATGEGTEQLAVRARKAEETRDHAMSRYHCFEIASGAFQIAIVLATATIVTGMKALITLARVLVAAGLTLMTLGLLAPDIVHHVVELVAGGGSTGH
ncbi:DUF4337 domain-containing protein [Sphingomonas koreensis]